MSRYILIRPIHLSQKKYKNMHLEQIRSCGHKFLNCTRLEILTHIWMLPHAKWQTSLNYRSSRTMESTEFDSICAFLNSPENLRVSTWICFSIITLLSFG